MNPEKKVSLFSKSMKQKNLDIDRSTGFPQVKNFNIPEVVAPVDNSSKELEKQQEEAMKEIMVANFLGDVTASQMNEIDETNNQYLENLPEQELRGLQELYYKELSPDVMDKFSKSKDFVQHNEMLENPVLKGKIIDDFSVSALQNTMFSGKAEEKRDVSTFLTRIYYDNYGDYEELDEKTYKELQQHESEFNSFSQLVQGITNTKGSQAVCSRLMEKIMMILKIWKKNTVEGNIVLKLEPAGKKISLKIREVMQKVLFEMKPIENIISACENQSWVNFAMLFLSLKSIKSIFRFNMGQALEKFILCWDTPNFIETFDELTTEDSYIESLVKENVYEKLINMLKKSELKEEVYHLLLKGLVVFVCFSKKENAQKMFELSKDLLQKIVEGLNTAQNVKGNMLARTLYAYSNLIFAFLKKVNTTDVEAFIKRIAPTFLSLSEKADQSDKKNKELSKLHLKALVLKCKDPEVFSGSNVICILQKEILSNSEHQKTLLQEIPLVEPSLSRILNVSTLCKVLASKDQHESFVSLLNNNQLLKTHLFENIALTKKDTLLDYCNEYYHIDSSVLMRDFLERNLLIIPQSYLVLAHNLLEAFLSLQSVGTQSTDTVTAWILENLLTFCHVLIDRLDLWYLTKEKVEAKKHKQYKKLKNFAVNYYQDLFKNFTNVFQTQTNPSENDQFFTLKLSVLSIFEGFGWTEGISTSVYNDLANEVRTLNDFLKTQTAGAIRFFVLSPKRKIDERMDDKAYCKLIRNFLQVQFCLLNEKRTSFLQSLPINSYFIRLVKRAFDNDFALYLEDDCSEHIKYILKHVFPQINLELISHYYTKNADDITSLIDKYSFSSYGNPLFSEIIFLFTTKYLNETIHRQVWTAISIYGFNFDEAINSQSLLKISPENYIPQYKVKSDFKEQLETISEQLEQNSSDPSKKSILVQILHSIIHS